MPRKRLFWLLFPSYVFVAFVALFVVSIYLFNNVESFYIKQATTNLEIKTNLIKNHMLTHLDRVNSDSLIDDVCNLFAGSTAARLSVIYSSGKVLGFNDGVNSRTIIEFPEIKAAFDGRMMSTVRYSPIFHDKMIYVAVPLKKEGKIVAVLRTAEPIITIKHFKRDLQGKLTFWLIFVLIIFAIIVALVVVRWIKIPLENIRQHAKNYADHREGKFPPSGIKEVAKLADALNQMVDQMNDQIQKLIQKRCEEDVVLSSMMEGVLVVDIEERVILINPAAARLLDLDPQLVEGRSLQEIIRKRDLHHIVSEILSTYDPVETDLILTNNQGQERVLQVHGAILRDIQDQNLGAILVLNDVTRLHRLETAQRDFVANVSHELRTPITSIKGFAETLLSGALAKPDKAERFTQIIARQADQLSALVEDLLTLSRIERKDETSQIEFEEIHIWEVAANAIQDCELKAADHQITIELICDKNITLRANPNLLEQAFVNLIDNAIKYSRPGGIVQIEIETNESGVQVHVRDNGCGIAKEHLPRLFERFYRIDKARSRESGGTGLGLSIVKHITLLHSGHVSVRSILHKGSTFTIHLPYNASPRRLNGRKNKNVVVVESIE